MKFKELFETKKGIMEYLRSDNKKINIEYEVRGNKAFFKVPVSNNKKDGTRIYNDKELTDTIIVSKSKFIKKFDPEVEIFNWLKSIDY